MYLKSFNKIETNRYEIEVEVGEKEFSEATDKAYRKNAKTITIPGFRKGKAPRAFIEKFYGEGVFFEDAINEVYYHALTEAAKEAELHLIDDKTDFELVKADKTGLEFKVKVTTYPEVLIDGYKGIEITPMSTEVTDDDLDKKIEEVQKRNSRLVTVQDRAAQSGDITVIDFKGFLDGEAFDGGDAENFSLELGSNQFIPGFEEQIVGHNSGEQFDITVKFPENYAEKTLAGKDTVFNIHLHEIKNRELPELDDEFAKDVSEFDTLDDYKNDLKEKLSEEKVQMAEDDKESQLLNKLSELIVAEIPEAMINNEIRLQVQEFSNRLASQGMNKETYMQYTGMDEKAFDDMFRPKAEQNVKISLALEKIAELENIEVSEEDLEKEYQKISDTYKMEIDKVRTLVSEENLQRDVRVSKAVDLIKETSVILESHE